MFRHVEQDIEFEMCSLIRGLDKSKYKQNMDSRTFYNYVICRYDPMIMGSNLLKTVNEPSIYGFILFLMTIFYIGKGKRARMLSHLNEARKILSKAISNKKPDVKDKAIITEFLNDKGIVVIPIHDNSNCFETFNRECLMIECIGLEKLCNKIHGTSYGLENWSENKRKNFGLMVLYSTYKRYINERLMPVKMNEILTRECNKF